MDNICLEINIMIGGRLLYCMSPNTCRSKYSYKASAQHKVDIDYIVAIRQRVDSGWRRVDPAPGWTFDRAHRPRAGRWYCSRNNLAVPD